MTKTAIAAGVDIGGTNTIIGFTDREGKILAETRIKTSGYSTPALFVEDIYREIARLKTETDDNYELRGIGIGAPMGNMKRGTIEHSAGLPWKGIIPLAELMKKFTSLPVFITNDANAAAAGEMIYGGARGMKDFVVITLGTGMGCGLVIDGKLVNGYEGFAGEIGHSAAAPGGYLRDCGCGKKGCMETYVSASGLKRTFVELLSESNLGSSLRKSSYKELDSEMIYKAAKEGDELAQRAFYLTGRMLGFKLADIVSHTNPAAVFLFGGLARAGEFIFEPAKEAMEEYLLSIYRNKVRLLPSRLDEENAAVLGASSLVWQ